jgi:hypothetical protein
MIYARHTCKPHSCIVFAAAAPECLLLWVLVEQASACWPVNGALLKLEAPASLMAEAQFVAPVFRCMLFGQCAGGLHCHVHLLGIGIVRIYGAGQSRTRAGNGSRSTLFVTHTRLGASQGRTVEGLLTLIVCQAATGSSCLPLFNGAWEGTVHPNRQLRC